MRNKKGQFTTSHGLSRHRVYSIYRNMVNRCYRENTNGFDRYGGRGIGVCNSWYHSFEAFIKDMGLSPTNIHQLDRINNDGDYEPGNCRWVTPKENMNNRLMQR